MTTVLRRVLTTSIKMAFLLATSSRARGMTIPSRSYRRTWAISYSLIVSARLDIRCLHTYRFVTSQDSIRFFINNPSSSSAVWVSLLSRLDPTIGVGSLSS